MSTSPLTTLAAAALTAAALALFGRAAWRRFGPLRALRRDDRCDRRGERTEALLRFGFGQERLVDPEERVAGWFHVLVFAAFLVLSIRTVTVFAWAFRPEFHLPGLAPGSAAGDGYLFVKDLAVAAAAVGAAGFLWRRLVTRPARVTRSWEGTFILALILGLMLTEAALDGALHVAGAMGGAPAFAPLRPVGTLAGRGLAGLGLSWGAVDA